MNVKQIFIIALFTCIKDARPDKILVATGKRIARLNLRLTDAYTQAETHADTETLHDQPSSTVRACHDASTQELYFVTNDTVYYSYYSSYAGKRSDAVALDRLKMFSDDTIQVVAVDWTSPRLYLSRGRSLIAANMMGDNAENEIQFDHEVDDMAVDPYEKLMFVSAGGQVYLYALGSYDSAVPLQSVASMIASDGDVGGEVTWLALVVDHHRHRLYALATLINGTSRLLSSNYNGTDVHLVYEGVELEGARALEQQGGQLTWARCLGSATQGCQLFSCIPDASTRCTSDDVTLVWETSEVINDVISVSTKRHSPPAEIACRELRCSHSCDMSNPYEVQCFCPNELEIDTRTNTCKESVSPLSAWLSRTHTWLRLEAGRLAESGLILLASAGVALAVSLLCVCLCLAIGAGRHSYDEKEWHSLHNRNTRRRQSHTELIL